MTRRLWKEWRGLFLPWLVGAAAGLIACACETEIAVLGAAMQLVCVAVMAAGVWGSEMQHRTLPLLLAQPCSRWRLWHEKHLALFTAAGLLFVVSPGAQSVVRDLDPASTVLAAILALVLVVGTATAAYRFRSLPLGIFLGIGCQGALLIAAGYFVVRWWVATFAPGPGAVSPGPARNMAHSAEVLRTVLVAASLVYLGGLAWLGRGFWRGRGLVAGGVVLLAGTLFLLGRVVRAHGASNSQEDLLMPALLMLPAICSAGFWTLQTRFTIGGAVLAGGGLMPPALLTYWVIARWLPLLLREANLEVAGAVLWGAVGLGCCVAGLWLGWRAFARLEWREASPQAGLSGLSLSQGAWPGAAWIRCRPAGNFRNLVFKEVRLQRPVVLLAAVFSVCWLATLGVHHLLPERDQFDLNTLLAVLGCLYVPIACLLAGAVSLGEERELGMVAWHLSLPVSAWRQWLVKLVSSGTIAVLLAWLLPLLLTLTCPVRAQDWPNRSVAPQLGFLSALLFLLGFWSVALAGGTLRALLTALLVGGVLWGCGVLGARCLPTFGGLEAALLASQPMEQASAVLSWLQSRWFALSLAIVSVVLLSQSYLFFRRVQHSFPAVLLQVLLLALTVAVIGYWYADLRDSLTVVR